MQFIELVFGEPSLAKGSVSCVEVVGKLGKCCAVFSEISELAVHHDPSLFACHLALFSQGTRSLVQQVNPVQLASLPAAWRRTIGFEGTTLLPFARFEEEDRSFRSLTATFCVDWRLSRSSLL